MSLTDPQTATDTPASDDVDFEQYWLLLKRQWLPAVNIFAIALCLGVVGSLLQKPSYTAEGKLLIRRDKASSLTGVGKDIKELSPLTQLGNPLKTEAEIILSEPLLNKMVVSLNLRDRSGNLLSGSVVKSQVTVKDVPGTDILKVSYKSPDAKNAALAVNTLMNLYIKNNIQENRAEAASARQFIDKQLPEVEATVSQAETALRQFKEQNRVVNLEEEAKSIVSTTANLEDHIAQAKAKFADTNTRYVTLRQQLGVDPQMAIAISSLSQTPGVQQVLSDIQTVQRDLAVERTRYKSPHPTIERLEKKEANLKTLLQERISQVLVTNTSVPEGNLQASQLKQKLIEQFVAFQAEGLGLASQINSLLKAQAMYKERISRLPLLEQDQRELEQRLKVAQSTYETLLEKFQEVQLTENQNIGNARIIESAAVPQKSSAVKQIILVAGGGIGGLFLAIICIVFLEVRDLSVKTTKEVRKLFKFPLLGVIPLDRESASYAGVLPARDRPQALISESYRSLRTNLKLQHSAQMPKVMIVSSAVPKEGKSTVVANLALSMAQFGRKVLLIDADLRTPAQQTLWNVPWEKGLSDAILEQTPLKLVIQPVMPTLDLLTSGMSVPDSAALLETQKAAELIGLCAQDYDFVIIDTPSLQVASDALLLGKLADGILWVANPNVLTKAEALAAKESLDNSKQAILGLVINGAKS